QYPVDAVRPRHVEALRCKNVPIGIQPIEIRYIVTEYRIHEDARNDERAIRSLQRRTGGMLGGEGVLIAPGEHDVAGRIDALEVVLEVGAIGIIVPVRTK